ncbi:MAG: SDR family oxidoreductase [Alphaproteobacteria bacterium]|nr:SDR family oxidoreductase [Alphaproteobacteria bacterium]
MSTPSAKPLSTKHAIVTGGGRGIGAAIAEALAAGGASLSLLGRHLDVLETTAEGLRSRHGGRVAVAVADVADEAALSQALAGLQAELGQADILVNNAGIALSAPFLKSDAAFWRKMLDVDLMSAVHATQAVLPGMQAAGWGRIVNIASTAALTGMPYITAYSAAKHALVGFTRSLAMELAKTPITVNAICPGYTDTDIVANTLDTITAKTGRSRDEALANLVAHNPQGRLVQPSEIGGTVAWLCSEAASSVTGQSIVLAGGELMP